MCNPVKFPIRPHVRISNGTALPLRLVGVIDAHIFTGSAGSYTRSIIYITRFINTSLLSKVPQSARLLSLIIIVLFLFDSLCLVQCAI